MSQFKNKAFSAYFIKSIYTLFMALRAVLILLILKFKINFYSKL